VPADRVAIMRKAFMDTLADPTFLGEAKKMALGVNAPAIPTGSPTDRAGLQRAAQSDRKAARPDVSRLKFALA